MKAHATSPLPTFKAGSCRTIAHEQRTWRHVRADLVRRTGLGAEEIAVQSDRHLVLLNLKGSSERGEHFLDGKRTGFVSRRPGAVLFLPAGFRWSGWEVGASTGAYLSITIDPAFVTDVFSRVAINTLPTLSPDLGCEDAIMMSAARGIGEEIHDHSLLSTVVVEGHVATLFAQLFRRQKYVAKTRKGGLAAPSLNRVIEKIDADLTDDLSLSQLAALAGLSVPHFCRAFKQSLGCPPHAFIVTRRLERAKEYLRLSSMPITDVAFSCGFSSSSHFANTFRRETGMTPQDFRGSSLEKSFG